MAVMASLTKSVTKSSLNLNTFFRSLLRQDAHYSSDMLIDSKAFGRLIVVLQSGKPMQAMKTDPALEVFTFMLLFLHWGHWANSVSPLVIPACCYFLWSLTIAPAPPPAPGKSPPPPPRGLPTATGGKKLGFPLGPPDSFILLARNSLILPAFSCTLLNILFISMIQSRSTTSFDLVPNAIIFMSFSICALRYGLYNSIPRCS